MQIIPIKTPVIKEGDDIALAICKNADIEEGDIIVVSSKAIATSEGAAINLKDIEVGDEAKGWSDKLGRSAEFRQAVLNEVERMNGEVHPSETDVMLTELKPDGLSEGTILVPNAGLDESNIEDGFAIGWPKDPVESARKLRRNIQETRDK